MVTSTVRCWASILRGCAEVAGRGGIRSVSAGSKEIEMWEMFRSQDHLLHVMDHNSYTFLPLKWRGGGSAKRSATLSKMPASTSDPSRCTLQIRSEHFECPPDIQKNPWSECTHPTRIFILWIQSNPRTPLGASIDSPLEIKNPSEVFRRGVHSPLLDPIQSRSTQLGKCIARHALTPPMQPCCHASMGPSVDRENPRCDAATRQTHGPSPGAQKSKESKRSSHFFFRVQ